MNLLTLLFMVVANGLLLGIIPSRPRSGVCFGVNIMPGGSAARISYAPIIRDYRKAILLWSALASLLLLLGFGRPLGWLFLTTVCLQSMGALFAWMNAW